MMVSKLALLVGVVGLSAGIAAAQNSKPDTTHPAPTQPGKTTKPAELAKPAQPAKPDVKKPDAQPGTPAGNPAEMQKMMEAWQASATPGEMHAWLAKGVGTWDGKVKHWMDPSMPPAESTCVTTITPMFGGRYFKSETKGEMPMIGHFEGFGMNGYNNTTKEFEGFWVDNAGTMMMYMKGKASDDKKTLTMTCDMVDPMTGQPCKMREVHTNTSDNAMKLEMFVTDSSGKEMKCMEIDYTRKGESATPEIKPAQPTKGH